MRKTQTETNARHAGRPSSGLYGTIKDRASYQRAYRAKNPRKRLEYRLRQAYNLITREGAQFGYSATYTPPATAETETE